MFDDKPEKRPATPMIATTTHFCFLLKIWKDCSERGRCSASTVSSCGLLPANDCSSSTSSGEMKGLARDREENLLRLLGAREEARLCSSGLDSLVLIDSLSSNRPHSESYRGTWFGSNATDETVDPAARYTPRPTSRHPSRVVNRRRSAGLSLVVIMTSGE